MSKILFAPFSIMLGLIGGVAATRVFEHVWGLFDDEEPPESEHKDASWAKVLIAAAIQGAIFRAVKTAFDRGARGAFYNVTGSWPGDERPEAE